MEGAFSWYEIVVRVPWKTRFKQETGPDPSGDTPESGKDMPAFFDVSLVLRSGCFDRTIFTCLIHLA